MCPIERRGLASHRGYQSARRGRGTQKREEVEAMHAAMCARLPIDRVEVCYDPGQGVPSDFASGPGNVARAARELEIDLGRSWMVGDRWRDIDCGAAAGCRTISWTTATTKNSGKPDFTTRSLSQAADIISSAAELSQRITRITRIQRFFIRVIRVIRWSIPSPALDLELVSSTPSRALARMKLNERAP